MAFRRSLNLRDLLVRAKLKSPESNTLRHPPGTFRCNSRHGCLTCPINIDDGRTTYTFSTTGETREIKQHITCKSNNLTYMIECKKCKKQYIGETKRSLRERFTEHRQVTNNYSRQHFSSSTNAFQLAFPLRQGHATYPALELQAASNPSRTKAREALTPYDEMNANFGRFIYCNFYYFYFFFQSTIYQLFIYSITLLITLYLPIFSANSFVPYTGQLGLILIHGL